MKFVDIAGQEKYKALSKQFFKNTDTVFFVFALNDPESFNDIKGWISLFK